MPTRFRLVAAVVACLALALVAARIHAADEPAEAAPLWSGLVPDDAFNAIVVYPRRVLTSEVIAKFGIKYLLGNLEQEIGFSPFDVDEAIFLAGPMVPMPNSPGGYSYTAFICKFAKPFDRSQLVKKWLKKPERYLAAGHRCYREEQTAKSSSMIEPAFSFLDDRTVVGASQNWLPTVLSATKAKSPLVDALNKIDTSADLAELFINTETAGDAIATYAPAEAFSPPFKPFLEFPNLFGEAKLTIHTLPEISLRLTLIGNDDAAAGRITEMVKSFRPVAQQMLPALQAQRRPRMTKQQHDSLEYAIGLAKKLADGLVPHQSGKQVTIEYKDLGPVDSFVSNMIVPELLRTRAFATQLQAVNSLQRVGMAMLKNLSVENVFPANAIYSKAGKPLLSWRVAILPYMGEKKLYDEFHLDEPWDSEHNKALIAKMPDVYKSHAIKPLPAGKTCFVVPVGKDTIFDGEKGIAPGDISDGLSDTILAIAVGVDKAVTWTKPDDMQFDPQKPLAGVGTIDGDGIQIVFASGASRLLRKNIDPDLFRWLILRNDGHRIDRSKL